MQNQVEVMPEALGKESHYAPYFGIGYEKRD